MPESPQSGSSSAAGPLLVLLAGIVSAGVAFFFLTADLRFVFSGISVRAWAVRDGERTHLLFTDAEGQQHESLIGRLANDADAVNLRYLPGDPERVRLEEDVHPAWRWRLLWVMLG